jgi:hypothetical protein
MILSVLRTYLFLIIILKGCKFCKRILAYSQLKPWKGDIVVDDLFIKFKTKKDQSEAVALMDWSFTFCL